MSKVNEKWKPGDNLNTATMEYLKESFEKGELPPATWETALKQASEQGLEGYEEYVIKEEIKEVKKVEVKKDIELESEKSKVIQILSKKFSYVDTSGLKSYADYIAEGVVIKEIGPNDFVFEHPNGRRVTSTSLGRSNAPTLEGRFDALAFEKEKIKADEEIRKKKEEEEKKRREEEKRLRDIEWAKRFPNLYNPDGTRK